jgi:cbb3-type cytochrome oxidase cytochrome c subunit
MNRMHNARLVAVAAIAVALAACNPMTTAKTTPVAGAMLGDRPVDEGLARRGANVYLAKGCYTCHGLGASARRAAPDLLGITDRRDHGWLRAWLLKTDSMIASSDPQVKDMLAEYKHVKMPQIAMSAGDADALLHYMAQESARLRGKGSD